MLDSKELVEAGRVDPKTPIHLVHGLLQKSSRKIKHAWIEIGDVAHDMSNFQDIHAPCEQYYRDNDAAPKRRFTRAEADAILTAYRLNDGSLSIGYWADLNDVELDSILASHDQKSGVFASNIVFSDPTDDGNRQNLLLPN
jgi:hypothetical protein